MVPQCPPAGIQESAKNKARIESFIHSDHIILTWNRANWSLLLSKLRVEFLPQVHKENYSTNNGNSSNLPLYVKVKYLCTDISHFSLPPGHTSVPSNNKGDGTFLLYKGYFRLCSYKETEMSLFWFWMLTIQKPIWGFLLLNRSSILKQKHTFSSVTGIFKVPESSIRVNFLKSYQI